MNIVDTAVAGVKIVENAAVRDQRGMFSRLFCAHELKDLLGAKSVAQVNLSSTRRVGAIRGLHYQRPPHAEIKIVRCLKGRVFDVAVDLRPDSPTFLRWAACELTPGNHRAFVIPERCAHGFQVLESDSQLLYLHTAFYAPQAEGAIRFDDPLIGVNWPLAPTDISERDRRHPYAGIDFGGIAA